jgi:Hsp20/alpha crystallin family
VQTVTLPDGVDGEKITAERKDGVLEIKAPIAAEPKVPLFDHLTTRTLSSILYVTTVTDGHRPGKLWFNKGQENGAAEKFSSDGPDKAFGYAEVRRNSWPRTVVNPLKLHTTEVLASCQPLDRNVGSSSPLSFRGAADLRHAIDSQRDRWSRPVDGLAGLVLPEDHGEMDGVEPVEEERPDMNPARTMSALVLRLLGPALIACLVMLLIAKGRDVIARQSAPPSSSGREFASAAPKTVVELQPFRRVSSTSVVSQGGAEGTATLVNLNPTINAWYLLDVTWRDSSEFSYHLENPEPRFRTLILDPKYPFGIEVVEGKDRYPCNLLSRQRYV